MRTVYKEIAEAFGEEDPMNGYEKFRDIFDGLELKHPIGTEEDIVELSRTVNPVRLSNHPVKLTEDDIEELYRKIVW